LSSSQPSNAKTRNEYANILIITVYPLVNCNAQT